MMRIATFNLESLDLAPGGEAAFAARAAVLAPQLDRLQADILCLQEVNGQHVPGSSAGVASRRELKALRRLLSDTCYRDYHLVATSPRAAPQAEGARGIEAPVADVHNLVILSRLPPRASEELRHQLVPPLSYAARTARPPEATAMTLEWDRPLLHAVYDTVAGGGLHVVNLHLRSPLAAPVPGQKRSAGEWDSLGGWAEGCFAASLKRSGQALEARLLVERIFDAEPEALIAVCGDLNAGEEETPARILMAEESGAPALAGRVLEALERRLPEAERYTLVHRGRRRMLDHILCSPALATRCRGVAADNESLPDEMRMADGDPRSNHAPLGAVFDL